MNEGKQEAHSEVGQPVYSASDHEGGRSVTLFKQFPGQDEGDATWQRREQTISYKKATDSKEKKHTALL